MPSKAVSYGISAVAAAGGIVLMSYAAAQIDKLKTKAEKDKSPWIAGVVFGVLFIVAGIAYAAMTYMSGDAVAPFTPPTTAAGSASAATVPAQNPITAIENAARAKKNAAEHAAANAVEIEKAAKALNAVMKSSET